VWFVSNLKDKHRAAALYATKDEVRAWQWLDGHVKEKEVVLALPAASLRIAKYTPASVVAAHYSVSPRFEEMYRVIRETLMGLNSAMQLNQLNVDYVYIGPLEKRMKNIQITKDPYLKPVYTNPSVFIFRVSR